MASYHFRAREAPRLRALRSRALALSAGPEEELTLPNGKESGVHWLKDRRSYQPPPIENRTFAMGGTPTGKGSARDERGVGRRRPGNTGERLKVTPEVGLLPPSYFRLTYKVGGSLKKGIRER